MAEHTPGPWEVWVGHADVFAAVKRNDPGSICGRRVARCGSDFDDGCQEDVANASLIAAAPELLAACEGLLDGLDANGDPERCGLSQRQWAERVAVARAAVAGARTPTP